MHVRKNKIFWLQNLGETSISPVHAQQKHHGGLILTDRPESESMREQSSDNLN